MPDDKVADVDLKCVSDADEPCERWRATTLEHLVEMRATDFRPIRQMRNEDPLFARDLADAPRYPPMRFFKARRHQQTRA
jgi:hypothetical protein